MDFEKIKAFQAKICYEYLNRDLLETALTHSSFANEHQLAKFQNNERLEFLGDAVLELVSSDLLFKSYPEKLEGALSKTRASLVCRRPWPIAPDDWNWEVFLSLAKVKT